MSTEYVVEAVHRGGMHFVSQIGERSVSLDYPLAPGDPGAGPKPMEMLLAGLASCAGGSVAALMRRAGQGSWALKVTARGLRRSEHPTVFTEIALDFQVEGDVDRAVVADAVKRAETDVCPIWAMLKPGTPIRASISVNG